MYKTRQRNLLQSIKETNSDGVFMMVPNNIYYFTGFLSEPHERFFALYVDVKTNKTILFVPSLDESAAQEVAEVDQIIPISDTDSPYEIFAQQIGQAPELLSLEKNYLTIEKLEQLKQQIPTFSYQDMEIYIRQMRANKTPNEIEKVKQAIAISEEALQHTWNHIKVGMTELELKAELEYQMTVLGADAIAFETIALSGKRAALPHGSSSDIAIENGDFLLFDFGVTKDGYHSDLTRTCIVGEGTKEQRQIYNTVREANEAAIKAVEIGASMQVIDRAARHVIEAKGYGDYFTHRIGHGLGLDVHEYPSIHYHNEEQITKGLLFTVEPGIYVPNIGGVRIEDDIYMTEDGKMEVLSSFTKDLIYV